MKTFHPYLLILLALLYAMSSVTVGAMGKMGAWVEMGPTQQHSAHHFNHTSAGGEHHHSSLMTPLSHHGPETSSANPSWETCSSEGSSEGECTFHPEVSCQQHCGMAILPSIHVVGQDGDEDHDDFLKTSPPQWANGSLYKPPIG